MAIWNDLLRLQTELDRALRTPGDFFREAAPAGVFPPVNVFRRDDGVVIRAEMPGVAPADLDIASEGRRLTIRGERKAGAPSGGGYHRRERAYGKFARSITLPDDLEASAAKAALHDGVLTITIPQREAAKRRQITVEGR